MRLLFILALASLACGVPALPTQTDMPLGDTQTPFSATLTPSPTPRPVKITGDVWLRRDGQAVTVAPAGVSFIAECEGLYCTITAGTWTGLTFWRGCSDDPQGKGCR